MATDWPCRMDLGFLANEEKKRKLISLLSSEKKNGFTDRPIFVLVPPSLCGRSHEL